MSTPDTPSEASNQNAAIQSPGAILRTAREQLGMQREQVSSETNLSLRYVDALEADNYSLLPGQAFARGYLRRYAQLVRVDSDALVPAFEQLWQAQRPEQVAGLGGAAAKPTPRVPVATPARLSESVTESVAQLGQQVSRISMAQLLSWGSLVLLLILLAGTFFWQDGERSDTPAPVAIDVDAPPPGEVPATELSALPAAEPAVTPPEGEPGAIPGNVPGTDPTAASVAPAGAPAAAPAGAAPAAPAAAMPVPAAQPRPAVPAATTAAPAAAAPAAVIPVAPAASPRPAATAAYPSTPLTAKPAAVMPAPAATQVKPTVPGTALPAATTPPVTAKPAMDQQVVQTSARIDSLSFNFNGKSWISVRDATGQELVYGLKDAGQMVTVSGQPPFSINIGNVAVTTLTRNGKNVSLKPYTRGEIASFRLNP